MKAFPIAESEPSFVSSPGLDRAGIAYGEAITGTGAEPRGRTRIAVIGVGGAGLNTIACLTHGGSFQHKTIVTSDDEFGLRLNSVAFNAQSDHL